MFIYLIIVYIIILIIEIPPLFKERKIKEIIIYAVILSIVFTEGILDMLGIKIPSPQEPIKKIVLSILGMEGD